MKKTLVEIGNVKRFNYPERHDDLEFEVYINGKAAGLGNLLDGSVGGSGRWTNMKPEVADEVERLAKASFKNFFVVWTYVANYGTNLFDSCLTEQEAVDRLLKGFSEDFAAKATVYVFSSPPSMTRWPGGQRSFGC